MCQWVQNIGYLNFRNGSLDIENPILEPNSVFYVVLFQSYDQKEDLMTNLATIFDFVRHLGYLNFRNGFLVVLFQSYHQNYDLVINLAAILDFGRHLRYLNFRKGFLDLETPILDTKISILCGFVPKL